MPLVPIMAFDDPRKYPPLLRLADGVKRPEVRRVMGRGVANRLRKHFTELDSKRANRLGGKRTHFYGEVRKSVQNPLVEAPDGVMVAINHVGIAQRYFGGVIEAKPGSKLTIPVHPEAHGKRAREFNDLTPIYFPDGDGILVRENPASPSGIGEVYYLLRQRVEQKADATVLPTDSELETAGFEAGEDHIQTLVARSER